MTKQKYIIAIFALLVFVQVVVIILIETFVAENIVSDVDLNAWRYSIIIFVVLSMILLPLLAVLAKKNKNKETLLITRRINAVCDKTFSEINGELYLVDDQNKVIWMSEKAKLRIKTKDALVNATFINEKFKLAWKNPGKKFFFTENSREYQIIFHKHLEAYFCFDITNTVELKKRLYENEEALGFLEVRSLVNHEVENINVISKEFTEQINSWAIINGIVAVNIGDLNFMIYMRRNVLNTMRNNDFDFIKKLDNFLFRHNNNLIISLSLVTGGKSTSYNAEAARKGLIELKSTKVTSSILFQDIERDIYSIIDIDESNGKRKIKQTNVIPEGYSYQNYETEKGKEKDTPISVSLIAKRQLEVLNSLSPEKQTDDKKTNLLKKNPTKKVPDWLKKVLEKNRLEEQKQVKLKKRKSPLTHHSLLAEMEEMKQVVCYLEDGSKKDEFLIAVLLAIITRKLDMKYYIYSETPFNIHKATKIKLKEAGLGFFSDIVISAYELKKLNQSDTFYTIINKNMFNKDLVNTAVSHKIAYVRDSFSKKALETLIISIKDDLEKLDLNKNELTLLRVLATRIKDDSGKIAIRFFNDLIKQSQLNADTTSNKEK